MIHQDSAHGFRRRCEEVPAIGEAWRAGTMSDWWLRVLRPLRFLARYQPQIRFMHECRGIEGVAWRLIGHVTRGKLAKLIVNQRQKPPGGVWVSGIDGGQNTRQLGHEGSLSDIPPSLPVVQLVIRVRDRNAGVLQIPDGASDVARGHVVPRVVVEEDDQDALVVTIRRKDDKVMKVLEVVSIPRQDRPPIPDSVGQVGLITVAWQAHVGGDLNIVPITAK
jgi:hypothetical protein